MTSGKRLPLKTPNRRRAPVLGIPLRGSYAGLCWCRACDVKEAKRLKSKTSGPTGPIPWLPPGITVLRKNFCGHCGFERCPCATDCSLGCTGSNIPGQPGSLYEAATSRGSL